MPKIVRKSKSKPKLFKLKPSKKKASPVVGDIYSILVQTTSEKSRESSISIEVSRWTILHVIATSPSKAGAQAKILFPHDEDSILAVSFGYKYMAAESTKDVLDKIHNSKKGL